MVRTRAGELTIKGWPIRGQLFLKAGISMARICEICGKGTVSGNSVSKSKIHKKRTWKPNLVKVKTEIDGRTVTIKMCSRCLRSDFVTKKV